jgi:hypothetical protein
MDWPFPAVPTQAITVAKYAGAALGVYLLYNLITKGIVGTAAALTRGVVGGVTDVAAGVVVGAGEVVGIPATDRDQCLDALYAGRTWDASFACPAGTFLRHIGGGALPPRPDGGLSGPRGFSHAKTRRMNRNRNC